MYSCSYCSQQFKTSQGLNSHQKKHSPIKHTLGITKGAGKYRRELKLKKETEYYEDPKLCLNCGSILKFRIDIKTRKFCNNSCSTKHNNKLRERSRNVRTYNNRCECCHNQFAAKLKKVKFCCSECRTTHRLQNPREVTDTMRERFRKGGQNSAFKQSKDRRSVNEQLFYSMCAAYYSNVECNVPQFNGWDADVILQDQRIAVLWNGKWHYTKLTKSHSVAQVQNRDKIKINEIIKCGFIPYVIKDLGRPGKTANNKFVANQFQIFKYWLNQLHLLTYVY